MTMNNVMNNVAEGVIKTANMIENIKHYTPIKTNNYSFPVKEIPLKGAIETLDGSDEHATPDVQLIPTNMKGIIRTDTNEIISCVSDKYSLVPHEQVVTVLETNLKKHYDYERTTYLSHNGARMFSEYRVKGLDKSINDGDDVGLNLIGRNSYDASSPVSMGLQGLRLLCLNGMMGMGELFYFGKRHVGDIKISDDISREINKAINVYNDSLFPFWKKLSQKELNKDFGIDIIKDASEKNVLPVKYEEDVTRKWEFDSAKFNAWFLYNCYTAVLTHTIKKKSYENYLNLSRKVGSYFRTRFFGE